jgi:putative nucleotidyltransferase with HDIG domain
MNRQTLRVLLVEDNPDEALLIQRELQGTYETLMERVETEQQVLDALHNKPWDIVLCDYTIPRLDPARVAKILEELDMDLPFVIVSGTITPSEADKIFFDRAVNGFVSKDNLSKLALSIQRMMKPALAYDETLKAWATALALRDKETAGHSNRVSDLSMRLAHAIGISETQMLHIRRGTLLHDIGKMGVQDTVLLKAGELTDAEWEQMRQHPTIAYELLKPIAFLEKSLDIPYCHHERWDGTGYPRGLKGEEIPLAARIFTICDVYDAMTSDRPYRRAMPIAEVLAYIQLHSGSIFDPNVVKVFLEMMRTGYPSNGN